MGERLGSRNQLLVRNHLVHQADAQRLLGVHVVARERPAVRHLPATQRSEQESAVGDHAHLGLREHCLVRGHADVARGLVPEPAAHAPAVDGGDDRLAQAPHVQDHLDAVHAHAVPLGQVRVDADVRRVLGLAFARKVVPGAERPAGAGEDDHADVGVAVRHVERVVHLAFEPLRDRVQGVRTIQRHRRDGSLDVVEDVFVTQCFPPC